MHDRGQPIEGMSLSIMSWSRDRFSLPRFFACLRDYRLTVLVPLVHRDNGRSQKCSALSEEVRLIGTYLVLMDLIFNEEYWIYSPATENKRYSLLDGKWKYILIRSLCIYEKFKCTEIYRKYIYIYAKYIKYIMIVRWNKMFKFHIFNWNNENVHLHKDL